MSDKEPIIGKKRILLGPQEASVEMREIHKWDQRQVAGTTIELVNELTESRIAKIFVNSPSEKSCPFEREFPFSSMEEAKRIHFTKVYLYHGRNKMQTAKTLKIAPATVYAWIKMWGLEPESEQ
jgi:hypothetical protein